MQPLPAGVTVAPTGSGLTAVSIATPRCHGRVYLHGATVTSWRPSGQDHDVLFLSRASRFETGAAIRGGTPLCAPWFGPGRDGDRKPGHGFVRVAPWTLRSASATPDGAVRVILDLTAAEYAGLPDAAGYPDDVRFTYTVDFGAELVMTLQTTAGASDLPHEEALHTYLRVGDVRTMRLEGLEGAAYVDKTDGGRRKTQAGPLTVTGETDRVFASAAPVRVVDPQFGRGIEITGTGQANTVVWNPWADKGSALADVGEEWPEFVCVEAANALDDSLVIPAGGTHEITQRLSVR